MLFICRSIRKLVRLNLFADAKTIRERNIQAIEDQIITTRIYLVLLLSSLFVLILFTSLVQTTKSVTVSTPSESEYLRLESAYPNTLTCPCREIAIPYDRFLSINLIYHQVCSSDFISQEWIASLFNRETVYITPLDLRLSISSQFRFLNGMCNNSKLLVDQTRDATIVDKLITAQVLSNDSFNVQVDALVTQFNATLQVYIRPSESFKMVMFTLDQMRVHSAINMDAFTTGIPNITQYSDIWNFYPLNDNASFNNNLENDFGYCDAFHTYTYKAGFYSWGSELRSLESMMTPFPSPIYVVRGMHVGCRPYDAIIISNLQCLFDSICLNSTIPWISTLNQSNWPKQLGKSIPSRFYLNDTIETILEQHMIEEYIIQKNFSEYYSVCNPIECTCTYTGYNDFSYAITMIISLFGGLIVVLRIVSPLIVQLIRYIQSLNQANGSSEQRETSI